MSKKLFLFPFGGNAREALLSVMAINDRQPVWEVLGFLDDDPALHGRECCGIPVVGTRQLLAQVPEAYLLAVPGSPENYHRRKTLIQSLPVGPERFATIIHPSVVVSPDATIGYNTVLMPNIVVSTGVSIGNHCVLLPNTVVSHDSRIHDYCCVGSNISISGSVSIASGCYIGSGSKFREHATVGAGSLVGLATTVIRDIPAGVIAAGSPARVIKPLPVSLDDPAAM